MQGWHYGKGLIYYRPIINQPFAVVPALHSVCFNVSIVAVNLLIFYKAVHLN